MSGRRTKRPVTPRIRLSRRPRCGYNEVQTKNGIRWRLFENHPAVRWAVGEVAKVIRQPVKTNELFKDLVKRHTDVAFGKRAHDKHVVCIPHKQDWKLKKGAALVLWDLLVKEWFCSHGLEKEYLIVEISEAMRGLILGSISPELMSTDPQSRQERYICTYTRYRDGSGHGIRLAMANEQNQTWQHWKQYARSGMSSQLKKHVERRAHGRSEVSGRRLVNGHFCHANPLLPHSCDNTFLACANENRKDKDYIIRKMIKKQVVEVSDSLHEVIQRGSDSQRLEAIRQLSDALDATRSEKEQLAGIRFTTSRNNGVDLAHTQTVQALLKHGQLINSAAALRELVKKGRNAHELSVITQRLLNKAVQAMGISGY